VRQGVPEVVAASVPGGGLLLDVREDEEWVAGHAPGAVHIAMSELAVRAAEIPKDRQVYVIGRSGSRSAQVTAALLGGGWNAVNVVDGMRGWAAAGRPLHSELGGDPYVA
jgi:rhodanese-related sulfurtransferase